MIEVFGDAWELSRHNILCITTNGIVKSNGFAVMGKGIAKQAADRFLELPMILGQLIDEEGNYVFDLGLFGNWNLFSFPTKHHWHNKSDPDLIAQSTDQLLAKINILPKDTKVFLPRPGCGNGGLDWKNVKPLLKRLDDRFYIVTYSINEILPA